MNTEPDSRNINKKERYLRLKSKLIVFLAYLLVIGLAGAGIAYSAGQVVLGDKLFTQKPMSIENGLVYIEEIKLGEKESISFIKEKTYDGMILYKYAGDNNEYTFNASTGMLFSVHTTLYEKTKESPLSQAKLNENAKKYLSSLYSRDFELNNLVLVNTVQHDSDGYIEFSYEWRTIVDDHYLDEGVAIDLNANGALIFATAYHCNYQNENIAELDMQIDLDSAKEMAISYIKDATNKNNIAHIQIIKTCEQMYNGEACWMVNLCILSDNEVSADIFYTVFIDMETGEITTN